MPNLSDLGINPSRIYYNLSYDELYDHEQRNGETKLTSLGAMTVDTGKFTGRSPKDKFFVEEESSVDNIWWGPVNSKVKAEVFDELYEKVIDHYNDKELYVTDGFCGANDSSRLKIRIVSELAWQSHFVKNMFIRPEEKDLEGFSPEFTILNACKISDEKWQEHGLNSDVFVIFNIAKKIAIIGGTYYGGEMKKGIFSMMNYYLPLRNILAMHCSSNMGKDGDTALFFGLSGTGKTTLSTDPHRELIGDDEHGWDDEGIFNFEGGCYAKTINLSEENEPDIYHAIKRDALLENVVTDDEGNIDFDNDAKTQNTRVSYPIYHIDNIVKPRSLGGHPNVIVFLTCDAFGVLPPVAKLDKGQAMYHFLSGYTAKVAGTERGITEPVATFSPCFGGPFLTLHPTVYAKLLGEKIDKHNVRVYLVNTGWSGGAYGVGSRMKLPLTRKIIDDILDGAIEKSTFERDEFFGFMVPNEMPGIEPSVLVPRNSWEDKDAYDQTAKRLAGMFVKNFEQYVDDSHEFDFTQFGPIA